MEKIVIEAGVMVGVWGGGLVEVVEVLPSQRSDPPWYQSPGGRPAFIEALFTEENIERASSDLVVEADGRLWCVRWGDVDLSRFQPMAEMVAKVAAPKQRIVMPVQTAPKAQAAAVAPTNLPVKKALPKIVLKLPKPN